MVEIIVTLRHNRLYVSLPTGVFVLDTLTSAYISQASSFTDSLTYWNGMTSVYWKLRLQFDPWKL